MNKDIIILDHISLISATDVNPRILEKLSLKVKNVRKWRGRIERRKQKIKRLYE